MTTPLTGTKLTLKQPYPIADAYFPDGILPEHTVLFVEEGKGDWAGFWIVLVAGRHPWPTNPFNFLENPMYRIEPSAFL